MTVLQSNLQFAPDPTPHNWQVLPVRRQTLLFSATMTRSLVALQAGLQDAFHFQVTPFASPLIVQRQMNYVMDLNPKSTAQGLG